MLKKNTQNSMWHANMTPRRTAIIAIILLMAVHTYTRSAKHLVEIPTNLIILF